jgi:hypothetical protein
MPLEVQVNAEKTVLPMPDGHGELTVPAGAHVVFDPHSKILQQSDAIERYQRWQEEQGAEEK